mgnify:FL=1
MARKSVNQTVAVGDRKVQDGSAMIDVCSKCGEYELSQKQLEVLERRAVAVVLNDAQHVGGSVLRFARKALGLKQSELARALDIDEATVSRFENGKSQISRETQLAVAHLLALSEQDPGALRRLFEAPVPLSANG